MKGVPKLTVLDCEGAVRMVQELEQTPCGHGIATKFFDASGAVVRQDYCAVVEVGIVIGPEFATIG